MSWCSHAAVWMSGWQSVTKWIVNKWLHLEAPFWQTYACWPKRFSYHFQQRRHCSWPSFWKWNILISTLLQLLYKGWTSTHNLACLYATSSLRSSMYLILIIKVKLWEFHCFAVNLQRLSIDYGIHVHVDKRAYMVHFHQDRQCPRFLSKVKLSLIYCFRCIQQGRWTGVSSNTLVFLCVVTDLQVRPIGPTNRPDL